MSKFSPLTSPLTPDKVPAIVDDCARHSALTNIDFAAVATKVKALSADARYVDLVATARSGALSAEFIDANLKKIAGFLCESGLIGHDG